MDEKFEFVYDHMSKNANAIDNLMGALWGRELQPEDLGPIMLELGSIMKGMYTTQKDFVEGYADSSQKEFLTSRLDEKIKGLDDAMEGLKGRAR